MAQFSSALYAAAEETVAAPKPHNRTCAVACCGSSLLVYEFIKRCKTGDIVCMQELPGSSRTRAVDARALHADAHEPTFEHEHINHVGIVVREKASSTPLLYEMRSDGVVYKTSLIERIDCTHQLVMAFARPMIVAAKQDQIARLMAYLRLEKSRYGVDSSVREDWQLNCAESTLFVMRCLAQLGVYNADTLCNTMASGGKRPLPVLSLFPHLVLHGRNRPLTFLVDL